MPKTSTPQKKRTAAEIRALFLEFFEKRGHTVVPSSSLIPGNDPTLLFTNAGMVQFKDNFINPATSPYKRAASVQRCLRVGGKHNDLENVGYTARHHTFFEMLGNFSFGDYFKKEAIAYAWEFLTDEIGLPKDRLYATFLNGDTETEKIWRDTVKLPAERVVSMGEKDNFWSMGDTGPCGPCSEILIDQGKEIGCGKASCKVGCDCDRFLEIWNMVFMQFNRDASGKQTPLPKPCIDTGMGLERIVAVAQGVHNNYHSDLFRNIIMRASILLGTPYKSGAAPTDASLHVIADHLRAAVFLIADGITPGNEGRGYVLRRILRRAMRHGRNLGADKPFLFEAADAVIHDMQTVYPIINKERARIQSNIREEEVQFLETLDRGLKYLNQELEPLKKSGKKNFPGRTAFYLYETYGFPVDLTEDILRGESMQLDRTEYETAFEEHRTKAKGTWKTGGDDEKAWQNVSTHVNETLGVRDTAFVGYEELQTEAPIEAIFDAQGQPLKAADKPGDYWVAFRATPFYGESGGQVGDRGWVRSNELQAEVLDTQKARKIFMHKLRLQRGELKQGSKYLLQVDDRRRQLIARNHTLTHLLHAALNEILGDQIRQAGSYLDDTRLSFDFTHPNAASPEQLRAIERSVHEKIWGNHPLRVEELPYQEALKRGAKAFFAEKYGDKVRVISYGDFSVELCGGTHVPLTGEIGLCRVVGERSVAAKTRRIELISGALALDTLQTEMDRLKGLTGLLKVNDSGELPARIGALNDEIKELKKQLKQTTRKDTATVVNELLQQAKEPVSPKKNLKLVTEVLENYDADELRQLTDQLMDKLDQGIVALGSEKDGRGLLVVKVSKNYAAQHPAGELVKAVSPLIGGGGGGRPDMAQAGGANPAGLKSALEKLRALVTG